VSVKIKQEIPEQKQWFSSWHQPRMTLFMQIFQFQVVLELTQQFFIFINQDKIVHLVLVIVAICICLVGILIAFAKCFYRNKSKSKEHHLPKSPRWVEISIAYFKMSRIFISFHFKINSIRASSKCF